MGVLEQNTKVYGFGVHSRLYEIITARNQPQNVYALPFFSTDTQGNTPYALTGLNVYYLDEDIAKLNHNDSICYALIRGVFEGGSLYFDELSVKINKADMSLSAKKGDRLNLTVYIKADFENEDEQALKQTEAALNTFMIRHANLPDILGFGNTIYYKEKRLWQEIKNDYNTLYDPALVKIVLNGGSEEKWEK